MISLKPKVEWIIKMNEASARRYNKLQDQNIQVDISTHKGRQFFGYNYLELSERQ